MYYGIYGILKIDNYLKIIWLKIIDNGNGDVNFGIVVEILYYFYLEIFLWV